MCIHRLLFVLVLLGSALLVTTGCTKYSEQVAPPISLGRENADHIIVILHHGPPPVATDIIAEFDAKGAEVIDASHAAVDLGVGVDEAAPLAERNDLVDGYQGSVLHFWYLFCLCHEWFFLST